MAQSTNVEIVQDVQSSDHLVTVAFQGELGAFGDEAVRGYFGRELGLRPESVPHRTFTDVFRAVAAGDVDYGAGGEFAVW